VTTNGTRIKGITHPYVTTIKKPLVIYVIHPSVLGKLAERLATRGNVTDFFVKVKGKV
jgi:hypothetical protein